MKSLQIRVPSLSKDAVQQTTTPRPSLRNSAYSPRSLRFMTFNRRERGEAQRKQLRPRLALCLSAFVAKICHKHTKTIS